MIRIGKWMASGLAASLLCATAAAADERVAVTYELWHTDSGWKIFLSATHAPETVLQFR